MSAPRTGLSGGPSHAPRLAVTFAAATASFYVVGGRAPWRAPAWRAGRDVPRGTQASWPRWPRRGSCGGGHEPVAPVHPRRRQGRSTRGGRRRRGLRRPADDRLPSRGRVVSAADPLRILLLATAWPSGPRPHWGAALASTRGPERGRLDALSHIMPFRRIRCGWGLNHLSAWLYSPAAVPAGERASTPTS